MEERIKDRLPAFTPEKQELVKGAYDFMGLNHYTSGYIHRIYEEGRDYGNDAQVWGNAYNRSNHLIGPYAESGWLNVFPSGFKSLI